MALCFLAHQWAKKTDVKVLALTVDHSLRPESGEEAQRVHTWLTNIGVRHEILRRPWEPPAQKGRVQEAARKHRYALLYEKCKSEGIENLLTAHQLEDQVETFVMRLAHCSGVDGLAGIQKRHAIFFPPLRPESSPSPLAVQASVRLSPPTFTLPPSHLPGIESYPPPIYVVRPLLEIPKDRLIATCQRFGLEFVDDPTNQDPTYHRNRIRQALPVLWETIGREDLVRTIFHFQKARNEMHDQVNSLLAKHAILATRPNQPAAAVAVATSRNRAQTSAASALTGSAPRFLGHVYLPTSLFVDKSGVTDNGAGAKAISFPLSMRILQTALVSVGGLRSERLTFKLQTLRELTEKLRATATFLAQPGYRTRRDRVLAQLPAHLKSTYPACGCLIDLVRPSDLRSEPVFLICSEKRSDVAREPIYPGETLLWENRLAISLAMDPPSSPHRESSSAPSIAKPGPSFFVRRLLTSDYTASYQLTGFTREVPSAVRSATPAITDERDRVVALPTLRFSLLPELSFTTSAVYPLVSPPPPCSQPLPPAELTANQKFDLLLAQLDAYAPDDDTIATAPHQ